MTDAQDVTAQICACFESLARMTQPASLLGAMIDGASGPTRLQRVAAGTHDAATVKAIDRLALFRHCDERDLAVLVEKYYRSPGQREMTGLVPGLSHGMVAVSYRRSVFQSNASCAKALGLRSAHVFERALTKARERVRQALEERHAA